MLSLRFQLLSTNRVTSVAGKFTDVEILYPTISVKEVYLDTHAPAHTHNYTHKPTPYLAKCERESVSFGSFPKFG